MGAAAGRYPLLILEVFYATQIIVGRLSDKVKYLAGCLMNCICMCLNKANDTLVKF